jgi:hypothetical protein
LTGQQAAAGTSRREMHQFKRRSVRNDFIDTPSKRLITAFVWSASVLPAGPDPLNQGRSLPRVSVTLPR